MNLRNTKAQGMLDDNSHELIEFKGYALRDKATGNIKWVTTDNSNIVTDHYVTVTDVAGQIVFCHHDKLSDNPFTDAINYLKDKANLTGKELEQAVAYMMEHKVTVLTEAAIVAIKAYVKG